MSASYVGLDFEQAKFNFYFSSLSDLLLLLVSLIIMFNYSKKPDETVKMSKIRTKIDSSYCYCPFQTIYSRL